MGEAVGLRALKQNLRPHLRGGTVRGLEHRTHPTALLFDAKRRQFFTFEVKHKTQMLRVSAHPDTAQERILGRIGC